MQKVEGSSPFSRFKKSPAQAGFFDAAFEFSQQRGGHFGRLTTNSLRELSLRAAPSGRQPPLLALKVHALLPGSECDPAGRGQASDRGAALQGRRRETSGPGMLARWAALLVESWLMTSPL
jgi:hypothetical protein